MPTRGCRSLLARRELLLERLDRVLHRQLDRGALLGGLVGQLGRDPVEQLDRRGTARSSSR